MLGKGFLPGLSQHLSRHLNLNLSPAGNVLLLPQPRGQGPLFALLGAALYQCPESLGSAPGGFLGTACPLRPALAPLGQAHLVLRPGLLHVETMWTHFQTQLLAWVVQQHFVQLQGRHTLSGMRQLLPVLLYRRLRHVLIAPEGQHELLRNLSLTCQGSQRGPQQPLLGVAAVQHDQARNQSHGPQLAQKDQQCMWQLSMLSEAGLDVV